MHLAPRGAGEDANTPDVHRPSQAAADSPAACCRGPREHRRDHGARGPVARYDATEDASSLLLTEGRLEILSEAADYGYERRDIAALPELLARNHAEATA